MYTVHQAWDFFDGLKLMNDVTLCTEDRESLTTLMSAVLGARVLYCGVRVRGRISLRIIVYTAQSGHAHASTWHTHDALQNRAQTV